MAVVPVSAGNQPEQGRVRIRGFGGDAGAFGVCLFAGAGLSRAGHRSLRFEGVGAALRLSAVFPGIVPRPVLLSGGVAGVLSVRIQKWGISNFPGFHVAV